MKNLTVVTAALFVGVSLVVACGSSAKKKTTVAETAPVTTPGPAADEKPAPAVTNDQSVSPSLSLAGDIAGPCGIKPSVNPTPKFDYDKDDLTTDDRNVLTQLATCVTTGALKGKTLVLIGRADPRGTEEYNLSLGSRRSNTVVSFLMRLGVGKPQLNTTTRGALEATGTDEASWAQDRRVDIQLSQS